MQYLVAGQPDGVEDVPPLQVLVNLRLGEGRVGPEVPAHSRPLMARYDGLQHFPPAVGAMNISRAQHGPSQSPNWLNTKRGW